MAVASAEAQRQALALQSRRRALVRRRLRKAAAYVVLLIGCLAVVPPFFWMIATSFKLPTEVNSFPPTWIPQTFVLSNYVQAWNFVPFARIYANTIFVSLSVVFLDLFTSSLAGYAFARVRFPGRDRLFLLYLGTLMIPGQVVIIPRFLIVKELGWIDSYQALILPAAASAFGTFWMRQHFLTMPVELEDAARVDGASRWRIYLSIMLPLAGPVLATLGVFAFLAEWNSFLWPLIVVNSMEMRTLALVLRFFQGSLGIQWNLMMAAASISLVPVMVVYLFAQRYFVKGVTLSGLAGR